MRINLESPADTRDMSVPELCDSVGPSGLRQNLGHSVSRVHVAGHVLLVQLS